MQLLTMTALASLATMFQTSSAAAWNDGWGPINDGFLSVVFYTPFDYDEWSQTLYAVSIQDYNHNGDDGVGFTPTCNDESRHTFDTFLPETVDIRPGHNFCLSSSPDTWTDTTINYAGWHGGFTTCTKCGPLPGNVGGICIIPLTPDGGC